MPDNDPHSDSTHLRDRLGVPSRGVYGPQPGQAERITAGQIVSLCAAGDIGGARRVLQEHEHGLVSWAADPWRLLEAIAERLAAPGADAEAWIDWAKRQAEDAAAGNQPVEIPPGTDPVTTRKLVRDEAFRAGDWTEARP